MNSSDSILTFHVKQWFHEVIEKYLVMRFLGFLCIVYQPGHLSDLFILYLIGYRKWCIGNISISLLKSSVPVLALTLSMAKSNEWKPLPSQQDFRCHMERVVGNCFP